MDLPTADTPIVCDMTTAPDTAAERIEAVTIADVQRVARQYLVPANRTVVVTMPKGGK